MKEENPFDKCVEMFLEEGADTIYLERYENGIVCGSPYNSRTGQCWDGMMMISSIEDAQNCKYKKACNENEKALCELLTQE